MTDMVERVARAIEPLIILELGGQRSARLVSPQLVARAAIKAMRAPTLGMEAAAADKMMTWRTTWFGFPVKRIRFAWRAMIDAALEGRDA